MIEVTMLNGESAIINAELIEMVESRRDTIITMTTGRKIIVTENADEIVQKIIEYRQAIRPIIRTNAPPLPVNCVLRSCPLDVLTGSNQTGESAEGRPEEEHQGFRTGTTGGG